MVAGESHETGRKGVGQSKEWMSERVSQTYAPLSVRSETGEGNKTWILAGDSRKAGRRGVGKEEAAMSKE